MSFFYVTAAAAEIRFKRATDNLLKTQVQQSLKAIYSCVRWLKSFGVYKK